MDPRRRRRAVRSLFGLIGLIGLIGLPTLAAACAGAEPEVLVELDGQPPNEVIALRTTGETIEWIERTAGRIVSLDPNGAPTVIATVGVATAVEQRGLIGHTVLDGRRFAAWTEPASERLVVGELLDGAPRIVWEGTATQTRSISGRLETLDGALLLGIGDLTEWGLGHGSGALVTLDPDGDPDQTPVVLSDGWNNPFAFIVEPTADGARIVLADNAPDGGVERLAAIDIVDEVAITTIITDLPAPQRAPSAIVALPDGRYGVCGWLDGELRAYELIDTDSVTGTDSATRTDSATDTNFGTTDSWTDAGFERAGTVGACRTSATTTPAGEVVVATDDAIVSIPLP